MIIAVVLSIVLGFASSAPQFGYFYNPALYGGSLSGAPVGIYGRFSDSYGDESIFSASLAGAKVGVYGRSDPSAFPGPGVSFYKVRQPSAVRTIVAAKPVPVVRPAPPPVKSCSGRSCGRYPPKAIPKRPPALPARPPKVAVVKKPLPVNVFSPLDLPFPPVPAASAPRIFEIADPKSLLKIKG